MDSLGKRIRRSRENLGLTQEELAIKMNKSSKQTVSTWETDKNEPSLTDIRKLAEILGVTIAYLVGESEELGPKTNDNYVTIPKDELIELQRAALRREKEDREEAERKLNRLKND